MRATDHRCPKCKGWLNEDRGCDACDSNSSLKRVVNRRAANTIVRSVGLDVKRTRVCADRYSMERKGCKLVDLHGVDTITAAQIIQAANAKLRDAGESGVEQH